MSIYFLYAIRMKHMWYKVYFLITRRLLTKSEQLCFWHHITDHEVLIGYHGNPPSRYHQKKFEIWSIWEPKIRLKNVLLLNKFFIVRFKHLPTFFPCNFNILHHLCYFYLFHHVCYSPPLPHTTPFHTEKIYISLFFHVLLESCLFSINPPV